MAKEKIKISGDYKFSSSKCKVIGIMSINFIENLSVPFDSHNDDKRCRIFYFILLKRLLQIREVARI